MKTLLKRIKTSKGASLLEAVLTITVMSIGLWTSIETVQAITLWGIKSDRYMLASQLAAAKMEMVMADKENFGYSYILDANYPDEELGAPYTGLKRQVRVYEVNSNNLSAPLAGSGTKRIDISILWDDSFRPKNVILTSVLTDY